MPTEFRRELLPWSAVALIVIYLLSGVTALAYEVLWVRMLSLQFGVSIFGVVATAVAFMSGLGFGSLYGARMQLRLSAPVTAFGVLELGIALYALLLPTLLHEFDNVLGTALSALSLSSWYFIEGGAAVVALMLPAAAMGFGFPLILKAGREVGLSLGQIYGWNTFGGAVGALLPLVLLPVFGWTRALQIVATVGMLVAVMAMMLAARTGHFDSIRSPDAAAEPRPNRSVLLAYAGIGAAALMLEVGWARLFGMLLLRTEYVTALILAIYLVGIAIGSLAAKSVDSTRWLNILPIWAGAAVLLSLWGVPLLAEWAEGASYSSLAGAIAWQGLILSLITLPATIVLGAWLPVLNHRIGGRVSAGAWLYGANSIGAALGALVAGAILIPAVGTAATVATAALVFYLCGMSFATNRRPWLALPLLLGFTVPVLSLPPVKVLLPLSQAESRELYAYEDAVSITHVVERRNGQRLLLSDLQRMDASTEPTAVTLQKNQVRLPLLLHGRPHSLLLLGMGTGISAAVGEEFPDLSITAVELSRGAINAAGKQFSMVNDDVVDKIGVVHDDARRFLRAGTDRYDVIVGDLFHPDMVGRSALLSMEQFARAKSRLAPGGLFVQWLALNQFDINSLAVVLRTFHHVFPGAVVFVDGFRIAMVGPRDRFPAAAGMAELIRSMPAAQRRKATDAQGPWTWLGRYWGPVVASDDGVLQKEWAPHIEYSLPRARYRNEINLGATLLWLLQKRDSLDAAVRTLQIDEQYRHEFERAYVANELAVRSWYADLHGQQGPAQRLISFAYRSDPQNQWVRMSLADKMFATLPDAASHGMDQVQALKSILNIYPDHAATLHKLWRLAEESGQHQQAELYRRRLGLLSPLERDVSQSPGY